MHRKRVSDIFDFVIFFALIIGSCLVAAALASMIAEGKKADGRRQAEQESIKSLNTSLIDADEAMEEMDKLAKSIFKEMEEKHQELLFLFSMIEGKKAEAEESAGERPEQESRKSGFKNPKLGKIRDLYDKGLAIEEIARALGIGQGEVKLILNLGKGR
jgi:hypothetical protein